MIDSPARACYFQTVSTTHSGNNFDFLRFLAASMVWYSHCYVIYGKGTDWLSGHIPFESFGSLGVTIFFVISGYFITASYDRHTRLLPFLRNRTLRIFPALITIVCLSVFVLGPMVTSLTWRAYFHEGETWQYLKSMLIFPLQYELPGVFASHAVHAVNGSLWSLSQELRCYCIVALLGVLGILRPRLMLVLLTGLIAIRLYGAHAAPEKLFTVRWGKLELAVRLGSQFAMGALLYLMRDALTLRLRSFLLALALCFIGTRFSHEAGKILFDLGLSYAVIYLGFTSLPLLQHFGRFGDFSYGMYLYAFPLQQFTLWLLPKADFHAFMIVSFALTLLMAILSWHFVEKPALTRKEP